MSRPSASLAAKPQMPSQLDECGAAISTSLGMSGNAPTMRQPPSRRIVRPTQRVNAFGRTRGAFAGRGNTMSSAASGMRPSSVGVGQSRPVLRRSVNRRPRRLSPEERINPSRPSPGRA